jgi:hypothetical protein
MTNCKNCDNKSEDKFCPKCGQQIKLERIDKYYISTQIQHIFTIDKGFFYTIKELVIRPGKAIQAYLFGDRKKHIKPFTFLILTSIIFALTTYFFDINYSYFNVNKITLLQDKISIGALGEWLNKNIGYTNLILGCFFAFWIKILFKKYNYNIYEIIVVLCFVLGQATLIQSLGLIIGEMTSNFISRIGFLIFLLYPIWAIGQFFGKKKLVNYIKSTIVLILGTISYLLVFILGGYIFKTLFN